MPILFDDQLLTFASLAVLANITPSMYPLMATMSAGNVYACFGGGPSVIAGPPFVTLQTVGHEPITPKLPI